MIRKISVNEVEEISGTDLVEFLRDIVCDNYLILRPSIGMNSDNVTNTFINNVVSHNKGIVYWAYDNKNIVMYEFQCEGF